MVKYIHHEVFAIKLSAANFQISFPISNALSKRFFFSKLLDQNTDAAEDETMKVWSMWENSNEEGNRTWIKNLLVQFFVLVFHLNWKNSSKSHLAAR